MAEFVRIPNSEEITKMTSQLNNYIWTTDNRKNLGLGRDATFNQYFKVYSDQSVSPDRRLISLLSMYYYAKGTELKDPALKAKAAEVFKHQEIKKPVAKELEKIRSGLENKSLEGQKQMEKIKEAASHITSKDPNIAQASAATVREGFIGLYKNKATHAEARELLDRLMKSVPEMDAKAAETLLDVARAIADAFSTEKNPTKLEKSEVVEDLKKILAASYTKGIDNLFNERLTALYELGRVDAKEAEKEIANIITDDHKKETWKYALTLYKLNAIPSPVSTEIMSAFLKKYPELNGLLS